MSEISSMTSITMFHRTTARRATSILRDGFREGRDTDMTDEELSGVWLSLEPLDCHEGACGDTLLRVFLPSLEDLAEYEFVEEGEPYSEWLVPADYINRIGRIEVDTTSSGHSACPHSPPESHIEGARGAWGITDHLCRECMGRMLLRLEGPDDGRIHRCSGCGAEAAGPVEALCACGMRLASGTDLRFRCVMHPLRSEESPHEVLVQRAAANTWAPRPK